MVLCDNFSRYTFDSVSKLRRQLGYAVAQLVAQDLNGKFVVLIVRVVIDAQVLSMKDLGMADQSQPMPCKEKRSQTHFILKLIEAQLAVRRIDDLSDLLLVPDKNVVAFQRWDRKCTAPSLDEVSG